MPATPTVRLDPSTFGALHQKALFVLDTLPKDTLWLLGKINPVDPKPVTQPEITDILDLADRCGYSVYRAVLEAVNKACKD